jgi:hypothetical protein
MYSTRTKVFVRPYQNARYLNSCTCRSPFPMAPTRVPGHKNRSDRTEMTDYDKGRIDAYKDMKLNSTEISERVDRPASTIRSYFYKNDAHMATKTSLALDGLLRFQTAASAFSNAMFERIEDRIMPLYKPTHSPMSLYGPFDGNSSKNSTCASG